MQNRTVFHAADSRGNANHGWLQSRHTFSFAGYYDPNRMNFGALRVLNDDVVAGGMGFRTHPHNNMEIVSIALEGALQHKDSMGNEQIIRTGDVQIMSAGSGITHSEANFYADKTVRFLQIWVVPKLQNITPRYDQKAFLRENRLNTIKTVVSADQNDTEAVWINQDAYFSLCAMTNGNTQVYTLKRPENGVYIFVLSGSVTANGQPLDLRDGYGISGIKTIELSASTDADVLLMEVPMTI